MMMRLREKAAATVRIIITVIVAIIEDVLGLLGATIAEVTQTASPDHLWDIIAPIISIRRGIIGGTEVVPDPHGMIGGGMSIVTTVREIHGDVTVIMTAVADN
jgi:hypothetical protein